MKKLIIGALLGALMITGAAASPMWETFSFVVKPQDAGNVVAAADKFMASAEGKAFKGKMMLMSSIANGADPTTHSFVLAHKSAADAEAWGTALEGSEAWTAFMSAVVPIMTPTGEARFRFVKSWGSLDDANAVWEVHLLNVSDPAAAVAALDAWFSSAKGKKFPGEAHLGAVEAAGVTKVTHVVSVGFKSEAAMEAWNDSLEGDADFAAFIGQISTVSEYLGETLSREVKEWGASIKKIVK